MSGETEQEVSAWTVDSLRIHLTEIIGEKVERISSEMDAIQERYDTLLAERELRYGERFDAGQVAISAALSERQKAVQAAFDAQETAIELALAGLRNFYDTVLHERDQRYEARYAQCESSLVTGIKNLQEAFESQIDQLRNETVLAMAAAEKAIEKAEVATEKRFSSVNEFRAQQADIIQTFARKTEIDQRLIGLAEKVEACVAQTLQLGGTTMPRNEYDRAHTDLADRVIALDKSMSEKLETQAKAFDARIALLQAQLSSVEAITR